MLTRRFIRIKVLQAAYQYAILQSANQGGEPLTADLALRLLRENLGNFQTLQQFLLELLPIFNLRAQYNVEDEKKKNYPRYDEIKRLTPFAEDKLVLAIDENDALDNEYVRDLRSNVDNAVFLHVFKAFVQSPFYQSYLLTPAADRKVQLARSQRLVEEFYGWVFQSWYEELDFEERILEENKAQQGLLPANQDFFQRLFVQAPVSYSTDLQLAIVQLVERIKGLKDYPDRETRLLSRPLQPDDQQFADTLLLRSLKHSAEHQEMIKANLARWAIDRIKITDRLLIELGITELLYCPDIPAQVTLSEYVDIANFFGANEQLGFVNGILDNIHDQLQEQGRVQKHVNVRSLVREQSTAEKRSDGKGGEAESDVQGSREV